jgi:ketosteroid isomerase-like protein
MGTNGDVIKRIYAALANGDALVHGRFDAAYVGPDVILQQVFMTLVTEVDGFTLMPSNIIDGGDAVAVEGRYAGTVKATGVRLDVEFMHVFELRGGEVVRFRQYTENHALDRSVGPLIGPA